MSEDKEYLSKEKFKELEKELEFLKRVKRKEIAETLEFAKSLGDLSENAEYQEARQDQAETEDRIGQLEALLKTAEIAPARHGGSVSVGSVVVIKRKGEKETRTYTIVGAEEANTSEGKISYKSPIGEALVNHQKGDEVVCKTPGGDVVCAIIDVK